MCKFRIRSGMARYTKYKLYGLYLVALVTVEVDAAAVLLLPTPLPPSPPAVIVVVVLFLLFVVVCKVVVDFPLLLLDDETIR